MEDRFGLSALEFQRSGGVEDWRVLAIGASAWFAAPSLAAGARQGDGMWTVWDAGVVIEHRIRFEGAGTDAMSVATAIADADGIDLTSSAAPVALGDGKVRLDFTVEGSIDEVAAAVADIGARLPEGGSIVLEDH